MAQIIEQTADGSRTLYVPQMDEHYHSIKGARTESQHIFIQMGLQASEISSPRVLEVGFGTGLNAWLTLCESERVQRSVYYTGLELYPLLWETVAQLEYVDKEERIMVDGATHSAFHLFEEMHRAPWGREVALTPHFTLRKEQTDVTRTTLDAYSAFDVIYFDAFAPEKQPEMWTQELFFRLYALLNPDGMLTTYCAKGCVRRMLQTVGFAVERLAGPPGGKREILRARKTV